ncbi:hypothetical protein FEM48_Zijuj05G0176800 [Ziziphus jujuba var. spinosa]|uniref:Uncharacterized protein n=1 Tax=Ziziphus jujuba var. spinosa TaxID=714518 RepID=A0A978VG79_ZIZJJ|nr:hypothetical protein FEM48_Zijuj05G0176800 [Ziziphus jujuba var. spinosa]
MEEEEEPDNISEMRDVEEITTKKCLVAAFVKKYRIRRRDTMRTIETLRLQVWDRDKFMIDQTLIEVSHPLSEFRKSGVETQNVKMLMNPFCEMALPKVKSNPISLAGLPT